MKIRNIIVAVVSLLLLSGSAFSQSKKEKLKVYIEVGDSCYNASNYYGAHQSYKNAIKLLENELKKDDIQLAWKCAESCRKYQNYTAAGNYYKLTISKDSTSYPLAKYWYAEMLKYQGKYRAASKAFKDYYGGHKRDNDYFSKKAKHEIANCKDSVKTVGVSDEFEKDNNMVHIEDKDINSQFSEYSPLQYNDSILFFSGIRPLSAEMHDTALKFSNYYTKIFQSNYIDSTWQRALEVSNLNTDNSHAGNLTFAGDKKTAYFSRCELKEKFYCEVYKAKYVNNKFTDIEKLPAIINKKGYNTTNPHIAVTHQYGELLFFSSDRPGGKGNRDIWYSRINEDGSFEKPINCGEGVNTFGDEVTPFYDARDSLLFFSSELHTSLGGYDIFKSQGSLSNDTWGKAENVGTPVNTSYNETYYSYSLDSTKAFFVSNRPGSVKLVAQNEKAQSNDIYYFPLLKKTRIRLSDLVPIYLFFDNDRPDPGVKDTVSSSIYEDLFIEYLARKEEYIKKNRSFWDQKALRDYKEQNVLTFFDSLEVGFQKLFLFAELMQVLLEDGEDIVVSFKGYASPLGNTAYNKIVAKKRISCVQNFFNSFEGGRYNEYLDNVPGSGNGSLRYNQYPMGETVAEGTFTVNGEVINQNELEKSKEKGVYDPAAALQRKIEILAVNFEEAEAQEKAILEELENRTKKIEEEDLKELGLYPEDEEQQTDEYSEESWNEGSDDYNDQGTEEYYEEGTEEYYEEDTTQYYEDNYSDDQYYEEENNGSN